SRRHAELVTDDKGVQVRDLGSSNGTFLNGSRVETCTLSLGDTVTFGKVPFKLQQVSASPTPVTQAPKEAPAGATIVRQLPLRNTPGTAFQAIKSGEQAAIPTVQERVEEKLKILLDVSTQLGKAVNTDAI